MNEGYSAFEHLVIEGLKEMKKGLAAVGELAQQSYQQAAKTNGTVADLKQWREQIDAWRAELDVDRVTAVAFDAGAASERRQYRERAIQIWRAAWSPAVKGVGLLSLVTAGFTLGQIRDWWPL